MIYLDHAATTPVDPLVLEAMIPYYSQHFGNPSNVYALALESRRALDVARAKVAKALNASQPNEIVFTGCGSESDNLAIIGLAQAQAHKNLGNHIITSTVEHHAVLHSCDYLKSQGFKVTKIGVNEYGQVNPNDIANAITPETTLITVMLANNEIGTIEPIEEISKIIKGTQVLLHTDAVQAVGGIPIDVQKLGVHALSMSAHKFYGPKGVGALYLRTGVKPQPVLFGGGQEFGLRSGTENVPGIVGLSTALEMAVDNLPKSVLYVTELRDYLISQIMEKIPNTILTGHPKDRLPGSASFVFEGVEGESLIIQLNKMNICASSGSACNSSLGISPVLQALNIPTNYARGSLRLTLGRHTTKEDLDVAIASTVKAVAKIRSVSGISGKNPKKSRRN